MKSLSVQLPGYEEARIRAVYGSRGEDPREDPRYSWFNLGHLFRVGELERRSLALLKQYGIVPLSDKQILEIGCGTGDWLREFIKWGARPEHLTGIDLLSDRVAIARHLLPETVKIYCGNAVQLAFPDTTFDLVLQSTVFTSVLDPDMRQRMASEMVRVMKGDGIILWYDYHVNNPWNSDVSGVKKREIYRLFPGCRIDLQRITLVPQLVRLVAPCSWSICYILERIPWLCTHYLGVIQRGEMDARAIPTLPRP
jgi:ubiquinone/menaquinone biosynthesis C-methylase UbiE